MNALISVQRTKTLELFQSEKLGEKPPKANWFLALVGVLLLAAAYFMAVSIKNPLSALFYFFVAVLMVILATYLLFIAGSVVLCKILQKNKAYYYKKQHFVSVSAMTYRMKRNGAGLASICILSTMVLVMLSSTGSLYFGMEDTLMRRYPREISLAPYFPELDSLTPENINELPCAFRGVQFRISHCHHLSEILDGRDSALHVVTLMLLLKFAVLALECRDGIVVPVGLTVCIGDLCFQPVNVHHVKGWLCQQLRVRILLLVIWLRRLCFQDKGTNLGIQIAQPK